MILSQIVIFSTLIAIILVFYAAFELGRPSAAELVLVAELTALCICVRAVFSFVPYFNPVLGVIALTGAVLGVRKGFLTGSLTPLISNFIFGQGPWTIFQMVSWGIVGAVFGVLGNAGLLGRRDSKKHSACGNTCVEGVGHNAWSQTERCSQSSAGSRTWTFRHYIIASLAAVLLIPFVIGPITDLGSLFYMAGDNAAWSMLLTTLAAGFVMNLTLAASTVFTFVVFARPFLFSLNRVLVKIENHV